MRKVIASWLVLNLALMLNCSSRPTSAEIIKDVEIFSGASAWVNEINKLRHGQGVIQSGTSVLGGTFIYRDPATSYEFFAFDDTTSLLLLSNNPLFFLKINSRDFKFKLNNELAELKAGRTGNAKNLNSVTFYKEVGDSRIEIYFTPNEMKYVTSGDNKYRIGDANSTTQPDLDLWKLIDAANNVSMYSPTFSEQKLASDFYSQALAGKRRLILTNNSTVTMPQNQKTVNQNLNFGMIVGTNLQVTDALLGNQDILFQDRFALTRDFIAIFSLPLGNSIPQGRNCLSQVDGIAVVIRGDTTKYRSFMAGQGIDLDAKPATPTNNVVASISAPFCTYVAPSDIVINEVAPAEASSNDLIELYVQKSMNLSGLKIYDDSTLVKTLPSVSVAAGDYVIIHFNVAGTDETTAKNQSVDAGHYPGSWDFWNGVTGGLTGTDNAITIRTSSGEILDGVLYADYSNSWSSSVSSTTTSAIFAAGRWKTNGDSLVESDAVNNFPGAVLVGNSFQRKNDGYIANVANADWMTAPLTIGAANGGYVQTQVASTALTTATSIDSTHMILAMSRPITFASTPSFSIAGLTITDIQYSTTYGLQNLITVTTSAQAVGPYQIIITSPSSVLDLFGTGVSSVNPNERGNFNGFANLTAATVVISEVQVSGAAANDEFVELYNPTNAPISLNTWCLRTKSANSTTSSAYHTFGAVNIPAYGYYLVGGASYAGSPAADATRSAAANLSVNNAIILGNAGCAVVLDVAAWGGHSVNNFTSVLVGSFTNSNPASPDDYQSIERKNNPNATAASLGTGGADEFKGNGWDSGINNVDFVLRTTAKPQNSASGSETATP